MVNEIIIPCVLLVFVSMMFLVFLAYRAAANRIKKWDAQFREKLKDFNFSYAKFYRRLYAFGKYNGIYTSLKYAFLPKKDLAPHVFTKSKQCILVTMKIPDTNGLKTRLVFNFFMVQFLSKSVGWNKLEENVYFYEGRGLSKDAYYRINHDTKNKIFELMKEYETTVTLLNDWETVLIGKKNSLTLLNQDEGGQSCLDLQAKLSFESGDIKTFLQKLHAIVVDLSNQLH